MFTNRYESVTKQNKMSNRLLTLRMSDVRDDEDDDYAALDKPTSRIDQLALKTRPKKRDDKAKVRFLTGAVNGTIWGLSAL